MKKKDKISVVIFVLYFFVWGFLLGRSIGMDSVKNEKRIWGNYSIVVKVKNGNTIRCDTLSRYLKFDHPALSDTLLNPKKP